MCADVTVNGKSISMDSEDHYIGVPVNISLTISNNAGEDVALAV